MTLDPFALNARRANMLLLLCAVIWGLAFLFQKSATAHLGPVSFVALRALAGAVTLLPFALWERRRSGAPDGRHRPMTLVISLTFLVSAVVQQWGMETATVTNTGLLTGLYVVATPIIAWLLMGQRPTARLWGAVGIAAIGLWLLGGGSLGSFSSGDRLVALAAVLWGLCVVLVSMATVHGAPIQRNAMQLAVVAALGLATALPFEDLDWSKIAPALQDILFVGILSTGLTFTLFTIAVRHTTPTAAAVIVSMETVFAALAGYLVLGERLMPLALFGAVLLIVAVMFVQLPARRGDSRLRIENGDHHGA